MIRSLICSGGMFLAVVMTSATALQMTGRFDVVGVFFPRSAVDDCFQRGFRSDAMAEMNRVRRPLGVEEIRGDEALQHWLVDFVSRSPAPESLKLESVFESVQRQFPGAQYLAANLVTSPDRESLLTSLTNWEATANSDFETVNTAVFVSGRRYGALAILSRRIPRFSLARANETGGRFFNCCPHCAETHALELDRESRTLILSCPYCDLPFDVLALDTHGTIRRAPDFFEGFEMVEPVGEESSALPLDRVVGLWKRVADRCDYEFDHDRSENKEVWKTPSETWNDAAGDCEDTSILLADVLLSAGFDARVAIGWNGNIGQHAWVVLRLADEQFVIETTLQDEITPESLTPIAEAADFYQPEQLFDRDRIFYSVADPAEFGRDCFSPDLWRAIPPASSHSEYSLSLHRVRGKSGSAR